MNNHWNRRLRDNAITAVILCAGILFAAQATVSTAFAQVQPELRTKHYLYDNEMPHGMVAHRKLLARQSMQGYFQPVRLIGPEGSQIEVYSNGAFQSANSNSTTAGLMVGHIYRLKITNIPGHPGRELYPSIEMIGRLFPPQGQEVRFAIPVHIPVVDMEPAIEGSLVTRVVYLENPRTAVAEARTKDQQPFFDVRLSEDPIRAAEKLGRPMVIVRMGSRIPEVNELDGFGFGTPPMMWYEQAFIDMGLPRDSDPAPTFDADGLEILPNSTNSFGVHRDSAVRQVSYQEEENAPPRPVAPVRKLKPASSINQLRPLENKPARIPASNAKANGSAVPATPASSQSKQDIIDCPPVDDHCYSQHFNSVPAQNIIVAPAPTDMGVEGYQPMNLPPWPDEILIDGGDRGAKVVVSDQENRWEVRGLDSEDTIAHFDTLDGRRLVDASNRVAIYAPRFAAVRKIDGLGRTKYNQLVGRVDEELVASSSKRTDFSSTTLQNMQPSRHNRALPASGLENQTRGLAAVSRMQIKAFRNRFKSFEDFRLLKSGIYDSREKGRLAIAIDRAQAWNSNLSAQSTVSKFQLIVADDVRKVEEMIHIKTEYNRPQLRLVKVASTDVAHPGDEVEFTIRFDNVGDQPIGNVTIIDNLTGRLEYVDGTAECSVDCKFVTDPNSGGSNALRWEITEPLPATKGGVIRFKCLVR